MSPLLLGILAFWASPPSWAGGHALFPAAASRLEDRLDILTGAASPTGKDDMLKTTASWPGLGRLSRSSWPERERNPTSTCSSSRPTCR